MVRISLKQWGKNLFLRIKFMWQLPDMKLGKAKSFMKQTITGILQFLFCSSVWLSKKKKKKKRKEKGQLAKQTKINSFKNSHMQISCYDLLPPTLHSRLSTGLEDWGWPKSTTHSGDTPLLLFPGVSPGKSECFSLGHCRWAKRIICYQRCQKAWCTP